MLLGALRSCLRAQQAAPLPLVMSLVWVAATVPSRVLRPDAPSLLPWLLQVRLSDSPPSEPPMQFCSMPTLGGCTVAWGLTHHTAAAAAAVDYELSYMLVPCFGGLSPEAGYTLLLVFKFSSQLDC